MCLYVWHNQMIEGSNFPDVLPAELQELVDYWADKRASLGCLPALSDINLMDLYKLAPRLFICDRVLDDSGNQRYMWRYWGTALTNFTRFDATGKYLEDSHEEDAVQRAMKMYDWVLDNAEPNYQKLKISVVGSSGRNWDYDRLVVPLADKGGRPGHILGTYVSDFEKDRGTLPDISLQFDTIDD